VSRDALYDSDDDSVGSGSEDENEEGEDVGGVGIDDVQEGDIRFGAGSDAEDDEIDSDDALGSDGDRFKRWKFRGSRTTDGGVPPEKGDRIVGSDSEDENESGSGSDQEEEEGSEDDEEEESEDGEEDEEQRATLSKLMAEEKKYVASLQTIPMSNQPTDLSRRTSSKLRKATPKKALPFGSSKRPSTPSSARASSYKKH
jgi:hypothetical protein